MEGSTVSRKLEHVKLLLANKVESSESTLLEDVGIIHNPLPEQDLEEIDLQVEFCGGKRLRAPLMITGMTGGHRDVAWINEKIAVIAEEMGIAMGVGSQRAAIENEGVAETFSIARKSASKAVIVANIGAPQLAKGYGLKEAERAVEMVEADALAIHLNPGQEAFQDEGDTDFRGVIKKIVEISSRLSVPVIVKEVGTGLSRRAVATLYNAGVRCFDVAGLGGTNWIKAEVLRSKARHGEPRRPAGSLEDLWGTHTAVAIVEARIAAPEAFIIGSGGIRNGVDGARAIALGADVAGFALPALRALVNGGEEALRRLLEAMIYQIKVVTFLAGERHVRGLWKAPIVVEGRLRGQLEGRGIDVDRYIRVHRLSSYLRRSRSWRT
ncbi:MAG: type 2 isopentenyl-diphosphate Delta-isomerase [Acidilobaceae archaeon]|nr:type 2 isopentenyl-diphosphate Delta-isomerase [Acidilobaceae archaeon]MCX8165815.1 type 2 isopentenyl-diphosphate Delta-isomerase [Acidilobaceae archaeon]MDW7974239.1 type 2 isopentenyl-diphosphate Delta-isomerase [Sulfolobales archaeon]